MQSSNIPYTAVARQVLDFAKATAKKLKRNYIGTEHILLGLAHTDCIVRDAFESCGVHERDIVEALDLLVNDSAPKAKSVSRARTRLEFSPRALSCLDYAREEAERAGSESIGTEHIFMAMCSLEDCVAMRIIRSVGGDEEQIIITLFKLMGEDGIGYLSQFGSDETRQDCALDRFCRDLTEQARLGRLDPVIGRSTELDRMIRTLSRRSKNNPCLIGEPGVGKTAIVELLAGEIAAGRVPASIRGKRILMLDLAAMVAGTKYRGEFEDRIESVINEVSLAGNVILFMDELHTLIGAGGAEGSLDAANILKPALSRGEIQIIGATTISEYRKHIEKDAALERRFQSIMVEQPSEEEALDILRGLRHLYEKHHGLIISDEAVNAAVHMSARYINDRFLPDKAIDLLDEACAKARLAADKKAAKTSAADAAKDGAAASGRKPGRTRRVILGESDIAGIVADMTGIPAKRLTQSESVRLRKLETELHKQIISQDEAVSAVARAVRRSRVGLKDPARPIGSFLFLGPTGVGKTELAKALARILFGKEEAMIRVDMSEYMEQHSVSKLIGSPPGYVGYDEGGQLSEKIRRNPYCVLLFDEIEKAHRDVFHMLLQILDDGHITDSQGRRIDFKNTIIIMTSNAGAERIIAPKKLGFADGGSDEADYKKMKDKVMEETKKIFRPEFINRIDEILVFRQLSAEDIKKIFGLQLAALKKRVKAASGLELELDLAAEEFLCRKGFDPVYGARPLKRTLSQELEDPLALELLDAHKDCRLIKAGLNAKKNALDFKIR